MLIATIAKLMTSEGRAYFRLQRARRFAVGRIGASARVPYEERSLALLLRQPDPSPKLLTLLERLEIAGTFIGPLRLGAFASLRQTTGPFLYDNATSTRVAAESMTPDFREVRRFRF